MDTQDINKVIQSCIRRGATDQLLKYEDILLSKVGELPKKTVVPALVMLSRYYFDQGDLREAFEKGLKIKSIDPFNSAGRSYIFTLIEDFVKHNEGEVPIARLKNLSKELYAQYSYLELSEEAPSAVEIGKSAKYYIDYLIEKNSGINIIESKFDNLIEDIMSLSKKYNSDDEAVDYAAQVIINSKP